MQGRAPQLLAAASVLSVTMVSKGAPPAPPPRVQPPEATARPSPYALPFMLRPVIPRSTARIVTTFAPYVYNETSALAAIVLVSGQLRLSDIFSLQARWGFDANRISGGPESRTGILNPAVGTMFGLPLGEGFRFAVTTSISVPLATGGGENPDPNATLMQRQAALARSSMDNASFAINDLGFPTGISLAFLRSGLTAQLDMTVIASARVKGPPSVTDSTKVNSTYGLFFGYYVIPELVLGVELDYQYYLTDTEAIVRDPSARDNLSARAGLRVALDIDGSIQIRPGFAYGVGLHGPVEQYEVSMMQFDIPVLF